MPTRLGTIVAVCGIAVVLMATPALAHVGVAADSARPGAETLWTVHVPNESDSEATVKVELRLPDGFVLLGGGSNKGWDVTADGDIVTIEGGRIAPGEEYDFRIRVQNGSEKGDYPIPAIQTYSDGERVRWTGEEGSDKPAPVLTVEGKPVAPATEPPATEPPATSAPTPEPTVVPSLVPTIPATETPDEQSSGSSAGTVVALLAIVALGGGLIALARSRRSAS